MTAATSRHEDWRIRAVCAGDLKTFFTSSPDKAAAICRRCPVRAECLYDALAADAPNGVWGGLTRKERRKLPALPTPRSAAIPALRDLLAALDPVEAEPESTERTTEMDNAIRTPLPAEPTQEPLPIGQLLAWANAHTDTRIRKAAGQARDALDTLRARHNAEEQVKSIDEEAAALEARLAKLREQKAAIAPGRSKAPVQRDYKPADVRAWATAAGIELPPRGRVPQHVVDAWRAAGAPTQQQELTP